MGYLVGASIRDSRRGASRRCSAHVLFRTVLGLPCRIIPQHRCASALAVSGWQTWRPSSAKEDVHGVSHVLVSAKPCLSCDYLCRSPFHGVENSVGLFAAVATWC